MSIWQFNAAVEGYVAAHNAKPAGTLSDQEKTEIGDWIIAGVELRTLTTQRYVWDGQFVAIGRISFEPTA